MSTGLRETFDNLLAHVRETTLLQTSADTLEWDERTGLPPAAGEYRAEQVTLLRGIVHGRRTDPRVGEWLEALAQWDEASDATSDVGATVHRMREDYQRDCRLPQDLVEALSRATVRGQQTWDRARKEDRYDLFKPALDEVLRLKREQASCLVSEGQTLYDALLDEYEPGGKASDLQTLFSSLRDNLVALIAEITSAPRQPNLDILKRDYPVKQQKDLSRKVEALVGFDFNRGLTTVRKRFA